MKRFLEPIFLPLMIASTLALAASPLTEEHKVWRAAAEHVRKEESAHVSDPRALPILSRTSFPGFPDAISQLNEAAKSGFCGLNPREAKGLVEKLVALNSKEASTRSVFTDDRLFRLTDTRPEEGDHLGLSRVAFSKDRHTAYLNLDIGGMSGAIVKMRLEKREWQFVKGCAEWISWQ